jgi:hypothetical protein
MFFIDFVVESNQVKLPLIQPARCSFAFGIRISGVSLAKEMGAVDSNIGSDGPRCPAGWYCPAGSLIRFVYF